jgi:hypothetical protein
LALELLTFSGVAIASQVISRASVTVLRCLA